MRATSSFSRRNCAASASRVVSCTRCPAVRAPANTSTATRSATLGPHNRSTCGPQSAAATTSIRSGCSAMTICVSPASASAARRGKTRSSKPSATPSVSASTISTVPCRSSLAGAPAQSTDPRTRAALADIASCATAAAAPSAITSPRTRQSAWFAPASIILLQSVRYGSAITHRTKTGVAQSYPLRRDRSSDIAPYR